MLLASSVVLASALALAADAGAPRPAPFLPAAPRATPSTQPAPMRHYQLRRESAGGWSYDHTRFSAHITEDGSVTFTDHHGTLGLLLPLPLPLPEGTPTLEGTLRNLKGRNGRPAPLPQGAAPTAGALPRMASQRPDPAEECVYPRPCFFQAAAMLVTVAGTFDITDEIMRLGHQDPYRGLKAQFLASTEAFRQQLRTRSRERARQRALAELGARLDEIGRQRQPLARRQAEMRALAEDLDPETAAPARALIETRLRALAPDAAAP